VRERQGERKGKEREGNIEEGTEGKGIEREDRRRWRRKV
jgi:hypothetical protein